MAGAWRTGGKIPIVITQSDRRTRSRRSASRTSAPVPASSPTGGGAPLVVAEEELFERRRPGLEVEEAGGRQAGDGLTEGTPVHLQPDPVAVDLHVVHP